LQHSLTRSVARDDSADSSLTPRGMVDTWLT
jgi:hypothetical protein